MDFGPSREQEMLADTERSWLQRNDPVARLRQTLDRAPVTIDRDAVAHAEESGLIALLTSDVGGTHMDLAVCSEVHGYAASSLPIADVAIGAWLVELAEVEPGEALVGVARAIGQSTHPVPMAADVGSVVVVRQNGERELLAVVRNPQPVSMTTLDLTRSWARLDLDGLADVWVPLPAGTLRRACAALAVHRAMDAVGAAARLLEMTVTYAGQRQQFGAPIGSFQAVKHHCADMAIDVEAARSALWAAALALDHAGDDSWSRAASAAAAYAKAAASRVASTALQVHGGVGFTWEHDLHLFMRRIKVDEMFDGTVAQHRSALVAA